MALFFSPTADLALTKPSGLRICTGMRVHVLYALCEREVFNCFIVAMFASLLRLPFRDFDCPTLGSIIESLLEWYFVMDHWPLPRNRTP